MIIKEMRSKLNMTQEAFSKHFNIPKRTIENWESEKSKPPQYVIELLNEAVERYIIQKEKES